MATEDFKLAGSLAERLAAIAMSIFTPESNMDEDDPGGIHSYNQAVKAFEKELKRKNTPSVF